MGDFLTKETIIVGAIVGGIAFVLTFLAAIFGGVAFGALLINSILYTILFFVIGVGVGVLLEKLVPGIWESGSASEEYADQAFDIGAQAAQASSGSTVDYTVGSEDDTESQISADNANTVLSENADAALEDAPVAMPKAKNRVDGDYLIIDDKKFPNDPEEYAKAVRTMLRKDD